MLTDEQRQNLLLTQQVLVSEIIIVCADAKTLAERLEDIKVRVKGVEAVLRDDGKPS